jgi:protein-tyrosine-phosphatase
MPEAPMIVFVCEHGAAKSILAAAHFNRLAEEKGLDVTAVARGTNPDQELSEATIEGLLRDGLIPTASKPQKLSLDDVQSAHRIIGFCELPQKFAEDIVVEQWDDIPVISGNYEQARDVILDHLNLLLSELRRPV